MPKCTICGKRFDTLSSLREHHRAVHPNARFVAPKTRLSRNLLVGTIAILIVVGGLVGYAIYLQSQQNNTNGNTGLLNTNISPALYQNLTTVSDSTLSTIGSNQPGLSPPTSIGNTVTLTSNGKTEILYIGAEFCPYCAAERWSMVVALAKFGSFTNLEYMASAADEGDYATLSFRNASYSSPYNLTLVTVENEDRNHNTLQTPTATEQQLWNEYNPNSYPFVDIGGEYVLRTSQFGYAALSNLNWTQIGSQLNNPQSSIAKAIDGAANQLIGTICKIDGGQPSSVCTQSFATVSFMPQNNQSSGLELSMQISYEERAARIVSA
jgi:hypothetical protein